MVVLNVGRQLVIRFSEAGFLRACPIAAGLVVWLAAYPALCAALPAAAPVVAPAGTSNPRDIPQPLTFGQIPLSFQPNHGQAGAATDFLARGRGYSLSLHRDGVLLALHRHRRPGAATERENVKTVERTFLRMTLAGADAAPSVAGLDELPGKANYLIGRDPARWRTNIPTFGRVRYGGVYPGIDLVYYGNERQLEYDFLVAPGADPSAITLAFEGVDALELDADGDLVLRSDGSALRMRKPFVYQELAGVKQTVPGGYVLAGPGRVGFRVGAYDRSKPLIIDPVLVYSTYLGGFGEDNGSGIVVDATGIYIAGLTVSPDFPMAGSPYQGAQAGDYDAFVAKLNPAGTALIYSTYIGGTSIDYGLSLAVDAGGNAYVAGLTASSDFPTSLSPYQGANGGGFDAFVTKLNASGSGILYSTYLGGGSDDFALGLALDLSGSAYVTGRTSSTDFPTAGTPFQGTSGGGTDAFVAKLDPTASGAASLVYATYLGGGGNDGGNGIVVNASGIATVTGRTDSTDFPMGAGTPHQSTNGGGFDAILARLNAAGSVLLYATYLGGTGDDRGLAIARDATDNVYITGHTSSANFPVTSGAFDTTCGNDGTCNFGLLDAFVAKLNPVAAGPASLVYATYLGGGSDEEGLGIAVDGAGNASVTGYTDSTDFPMANALQPVCGMGCGTGLVDVFVTTVSPSGAALSFSTYLGGSSSDYGFGLFVDGSGTIYVTGESFSDNFPAVNPLDGTRAGDYDVFLARIANTATSANLRLDKTASPETGVAGSPVTYTLTVTNDGPDGAAGVRLIDRMPAENLTVNSFAASQGTCTVASDVFFHELRCDLGSLASTASATATITVTLAAEGTIVNTATVASNVSDPDGTNNAVTLSTIVAAPPPPTITGFAPGGGAVGTSVVITGTNLATATAVLFNGTSAGFTADSDTQVTATVPSGATTGPISVTTISGTAISANAFTVGTPPTITSFSPTSGAVGISVIINGTNFTGATSVTFNGTAASFTVNSAIRITTTVPSGATTGPISVTTSVGTATSAASFTVAPRITGFTPPGGAVGASVAIAGANFAGVTTVRFNGVAAAFHVDSTTQITATVPANATTGAISVTATPGGTATSATSFIVGPRITSFTPSNGGVGASVIINGANFTGASSVTFNGASATFAVNSAVRITASVPVGATTGRIGVTTSASTGTSTTNFTVNFAPTIGGFSPSSGAVGVSVVITGTNFTGATSVKFNGTAATFTVNSGTQITTPVPGNATSGPITVMAPGGTATSAASFTVAPRITSFTPPSAAIGAGVVINGANFTGATSVTFNGMPATFSVDTSIRITATVPSGATAGKIRVTTPAGTGTSAGNFAVKPSISSFAPGSGAVGTGVTITGTAFTGVTAVRFNGVAATFHVDSSTQITATVPANATSGPLSVTTPGGTATSATSYTVTPRITSFTPTTGAVGATVFINGANFTGATVVAFNGTPASYVVNSAVKITATVPAGATTGKISVTTTAGTATSTGNFTVP